MKALRAYRYRLYPTKAKSSGSSTDHTKVRSIKQDGDQWYCSVLCELKIKRPNTNTDNVVGIDVGLKTFATLSDGTKVENERVLRKHERRLSKAQRRLSKRKKGGNNRNKQRIKVAKLHRKVRHVRSNFHLSQVAKAATVVDGRTQIRCFKTEHSIANNAGWRRTET